MSRPGSEPPASRTAWTMGTEVPRSYPLVHRGGLICPCVLVQANDEKHLVKNLLGSYAKAGVNGRPTSNSTDPTKVNITFGLIELREFDIENQEVVMVGWTALEWQDELLKWDPANTGTSNHISLDSQQIWIPDILLSNALSKPEPLHHTRVHVTYTGKVVWINTYKYHFYCKVPKDQMTSDTFDCHMKFVSWSMDSNTLDLRNKEDRFDTVYYVNNRDWEFFKNKAIREDVEMPWDMKSAQIKYEFTLKRRQTHEDNDDTESSAVRIRVVAFLPVTFACLLRLAALL
ncbi:hypothetical protein LSH36_214g04035 [Paralvinella palmiformis]|uniref:Neurotransmitter-gated ion-channel ligand-binding domain-containing protein n=1 Tax=Paralvinella palmiformis TaxID=53620 RepID=A0AAD9N439_9ANNE|nr:hypothetical protein LSH36_214g04035 [Paralvinella palmiformis]